MNTPLHTSRQRIVQLLVNELRDRRRLVAGCYVAGLAGFIAAVSLDAASRPPLFGSLFWAEAGAMGVAHGAFGSS